MAEATQFLFDYDEVLQELIKKQGLHEGKWRLIFELGFLATSVNTPATPENNKTVLRPAGMILVQKIGIMRTEEENNLTLDASVVNPKHPASKSSKRPVKKGAR